MIARLRRLPWLAALLLAASPAVGGQLMPLIHPCAVEGAGAGHRHAAADGTGHSGHQPSGESGDDGAEGCTCIGSCHVPVLPSLPAAPSVTALVRSPAPPRQLAPEHAAPRASKPFDLLPPTTAPPLA